MADQKISQLPPGAATATSILPVVNGTTTQRVTVKQIVDLATANVPAGTIDTTGNTTGITEGAALPIDQVLREVIDKAAFNQYGANHSILTVSSPDWAPGAWGGDGTIQAGGVAAGEVLTGTLYYGALIDLNSRAVVSEGYQLPLPTQQGYLRADQDPASGWYFAEPVIVSDTEPPTPPGDPALPMLWIDPTGTPPEYIYSNVNPPVSVDPPVMETATDPLGIVNNNYVEPHVVGAVPVVVNGKRYLLPLLDAPASTATRTPMFTFADDPIKQQSDGEWIGFNDTGMAYTQPFTVGGIPVLVGGKKYLLPLIAE